MIYKVYGDTGAGKTSYTLYHIRKNKGDKELYTNIEVKPCEYLKAQKFTTQEFSQFLLTIPMEIVNDEEKFKQYLRENGVYKRVYAFDEIQFILSQKELARRFYLLLTIQRHLKLDFYIITQTLKGIPSNIVALGKDIRLYKNNLLGIFTKRAITYQTGEAGKVAGLKQRLVLPTEVYTCYQPHASESKSHWKLFIYIFLAIFLFGFGIYRAFSITGMKMYQKDKSKDISKNNHITYKSSNLINHHLKQLCIWKTENLGYKSKKVISIHLKKIKYCASIDEILERYLNHYENITEVQRLLYEKYKKKLSIEQTDQNSSIEKLF